MHHLTADDKALILALRVEKRWNVDKMILEFPNKQWKRQTSYYLVRKIDQTGSAARLSGSDRPRKNQPRLDRWCHQPVVKSSYNGDTGAMRPYGTKTKESED